MIAWRRRASGGYASRTMTEAAISIDGLSKTYQGGKQALDDVSFERRAGQHLRPARPQWRGQIDADQHPGRAGQQDQRHGRASGASISTSIPRNAKASIGIVNQEILFDPFFTPAETLNIQAGLYGVPKAQRRSMELLRAVHLEDKANAYARTLSGGMKRRLMVAKAMVHSPPVLVLDEPTAGVDIELRQQLWAYVRELNAGGRHGRADHPLSGGSRAAVRSDRDHQPWPADRQRTDPRTGRQGDREARRGDGRPRRRNPARRQLFPEDRAEGRTRARDHL